MMEPDPTSVLFTANFSWLGLLLVNVTAIPPGGACWPIITVVCSWPLLPTVIPSKGRAKAAVATVIVTAVSCAGVLNPGALADTVVLPDVAGWNDVVALKLPPVIITGELVIVPTLVLELTTFTLMAALPATGCVVTKFRPESSNAEETVNVDA